MRPSRLVALVLSSCLLVSSASALAQMSDAEKKTNARALYQAGVQLQDQGKPADALAKFEAAQRFFDAPTHLLHIAECQALLGKLVEASETYQSMIVKPLPPGSPEVFQQAVDQAKAEAPGLRGRIPTLKVTVKPDPKTLQGLTINVNDKSMPNELIDIARPVNPGSYRLTAQASGWATKGPIDLELREKEAKSIDLVLEQGSGGAVVTPVPPPYTGAGGNPPAGTQQPPPPASDANAGAEKPKPQPNAEGPATTGLLIGGHGGLFVPSGDVFDGVASAGGGLGIDFLARFAKVFIVGARLEGLFLGGPDASTIPRGTTKTSSTSMFGGAVVVGVLTSTEKVGFYGDLGFGYRRLNYKETAPLTVDTSADGTYFALGAGVSIPIGPMRLVPKVGLDLGQLKSTESSVISTPGASVTAAPQALGYQMFFVGLALFYNLDLGKKPNVAANGSGSLVTF